MRTKRRASAAALAALLVLCGAGCTLEVSSGEDGPAVPATAITQAPSTTVAIEAATTTTTAQTAVLLAPPACITEATGQLEGDACLAVIPTFTDPTPEA